MPAARRLAVAGTRTALLIVPLSRAPAGRLYGVMRPGRNLNGRPPARGILRMKLLKRGAEGDVYETVWDSRRAVLKVRRPKPYRDRRLDEAMRRKRTIREAEMLVLAKAAGVTAPLVYFVDVPAASITMQYVQGRPAHSFAGRRLVGLCRSMGRAAGMLHRAGIMHGDLTTSNFIALGGGGGGDAGGGAVAAVDFGLASRTPRDEDHAVDLRLFKEILGSAHVDEMGPAWRAFLAGYGAAVGSARRERIVGIVADIEARGRYATVV